MSSIRTNKKRLKQFPEPTNEIFDDKIRASEFETIRANLTGEDLIALNDFIKRLNTNEEISSEETDLKEPLTYKELEKAHGILSGILAGIEGKTEPLYKEIQKNIQIFLAEYEQDRDAAIQNWLLYSESSTELERLLDHKNAIIDDKLFKFDRRAAISYLNAEIKKSRANQYTTKEAADILSAAIDYEWLLHDLCTGVCKRYLKE